MSHYEVSYREREDEAEQWERDFGVEAHRAEDERADFARTSQVPGRQEDERG